MDIYTIVIIQLQSNSCLKMCHPHKMKIGIPISQKKFRALSAKSADLYGSHHPAVINNCLKRVVLDKIKKKSAQVGTGT